MTLGELETFYDFMAKERPNHKTSRGLTRHIFIESFLTFMKDNYNYDKSYFRNSYESSGTNHKDLNDFLYCEYLGLEGDLRKEYERLEEEAKSRIKYYEASVKSYQTKAEIEIDNYDKCKFNFLRNVNDGLLTKAKEVRNKSSLFRTALNNCRATFRFFSSFWNYDNSFRDIEQYENIDWKFYINFAYAPVSDARAIRAVKDEKPAQYISWYKNYLEEYGILENILNIASDNYYIQSRIPIFQTAAKLFKEQSYLPFVYLLVPQIEGLWDVYRLVLGIELDKDFSGLIEKLQVIYENRKKEHERLWGYIYYAFEFPKQRNNIAHGYMVDVDEEMAFDILTDIEHLVRMIDSEEMTYKIIVSFLSELKGLTIAGRIGLIVQTFTGYETKKKLHWLQQCLDGDFDDILEWYNCLNSKQELIGLLQSEPFRQALFNDEPLHTEKLIELNGKAHTVIETNTELKSRLELIEFLKPKVEFPTVWLDSVNHRLQELEKEDVKLSRLLEHKNANG